MGTKYSVEAGTTVFVTAEVRTNWLIKAMFVFLYYNFNPAYSWVTLARRGND